MTDRDDAERDDGKTWGFLDETGVFRPLPKQPMLAAGLGPTPFDVRMPDGRVRHVIADPQSP